MQASREGAAPDHGEVRGESNRDRVRRLLIAPLAFRFPKGVSPEDQARQLDRLCDDLAYMSDASLQALEALLIIRGQGKDRNVWPDRATVMGLAHVVQPRPLEAVPALRRWFGSIEGPRARAEGSLVETWEYFEKIGTPPKTDQAKMIIRHRVEMNRRQLQLFDERTAKGLPVHAEIAAFVAWYRAREAAISDLVDQVQAEKAEAAAPVFASQRGLVADASCGGLA